MTKPLTTPELIITPLWLPKLPTGGAAEATAAQWSLEGGISWKSPAPINAIPLEPVGTNHMFFLRLSSSWWQQVEDFTLCICVLPQTVYCGDLS